MSALLAPFLCPCLEPEQLAAAGQDTKPVTEGKDMGKANKIEPLKTVKIY